MLSHPSIRFTKREKKGIITHGENEEEPLKDRIGPGKAGISAS